MRLYALQSGGECRRAVNTSNSRSGGLGFKPRLSRCFFQTRNVTPLCPSFRRCINRYQHHTAGGNPAMDYQHPVQQGLPILQGMLHAKETEISSGRLGLWLVWAFTCCTVWKPRNYSGAPNDSFMGNNLKCLSKLPRVL